MIGNLNILAFLTDEPIVNVFLVGVFGALFFMVLNAVLPNRSTAKKVEAEKKLKTQIAELEELSVKQLILLNKMATEGTITQDMWAAEYIKILKQLRDSGCDTGVIYGFKSPIFPQKNEEVNKIMNIASILSESSAISDEEFERSINIALDNYKKEG